MYLRFLRSMYLRLTQVLAPFVQVLYVTDSAHLVHHCVLFSVKRRGFLSAEDFATGDHDVSC